MLIFFTPFLISLFFWWDPHLKAWWTWLVGGILTMWEATKTTTTKNNKNQTKTGKANKSIEKKYQLFYYFYRFVCAITKL